MADSKLTALSEVSVPDFNDDIYLVDDTGPTSYKCGVDRLLGLAGFVPGGRLTTESGVAVSASDRTSQGTLYYTPYFHNRIRIYDGTRWRAYTFTERSLSLTLTSGKNYDVFIYDNSGTLTLELSAAWTNDSTRADALTTQDGITVKSGATTRLWLGTIRASGSNVIADSLANRFVWNKYNQVFRQGFNANFSGHTYNSATYRAANAVTTKAEFVVGETIYGLLVLRGSITCNTTNGLGVFSAAYDWSGSGASGAQSVNLIVGSSSGTVTLSGCADSVVTWLAGYHFYQLIEAALNATVDTFDNAVMDLQLPC